MENTRYKHENIERKHIKKIVKEPVFKGKDQSFRIRKIFYRIESKN